MSNHSRSSFHLSDHLYTINLNDGISFVIILIWCKKSWNILNGLSEERQTIQWPNKKRTKEQTMIYKTQHRKPRIEQQEPHQKTTDPPERLSSCC